MARNSQTESDGFADPQTARQDEKPALDFLTSARNPAESHLAGVFHLGTVLLQSMEDMPPQEQVWKHALESVVDRAQRGLLKLQEQDFLNEYFAAEALRRTSSVEVPVTRSHIPSFAVGALLGAMAVVGLLAFKTLLP